MRGLPQPGHQEWEPRGGAQDGAWSSYSLHRRGCVSVGMNVPLRMSVAATWERCVHTWVSATQRRVPHPSPLPTRWGEAHTGLGSQWGSPAATRGRSLPQAVGPSTAQNVPSLAELAVGLISGVWLGRPRTLAQVGWRMGWGSPPGSSN